MPNTPLKLAGIRIDPPPSLPVARVHNPGCQGRSRAAAGSSRRAVGVPGIAAGIAQPVFSGPGKAELRGVGFPQDYCPGPAQTLHHDRIQVRRPVLEQRRTGGGGNSFGHLQVFHRNRYAVERPQIFPALHRVLRFPGMVHRLVRAYSQVGVQPRIEFLDAPVEHVGKLDN